MLLLTRYTLLLHDWRGYIIAGFALVWIANIYMSLYAFLRIDIKKERILTRKEEENIWRHVTQIYLRLFYQLLDFLKKFSRVQWLRDKLIYTQL